MYEKRDIREMMFQIEMARKSRLQPLWNEMGLIAGQPRVLSRLVIKDHVTQRELSDACYIEPATLSRALDRLEAMGYIIRNTNPSCRRSFLISLTKEGRVVATAVKKIFDEIEEWMVEGFSKEEIDSMAKMLERMKGNMS